MFYFCFQKRIFENFKKIRFYPDKFSDYLLKEVGFASVERLATPAHHSKGFQRPMLVFTKPTEEASGSPKSSVVVDEVQKLETPEIVPAATSPSASLTGSNNNSQCKSLEED